jgi:hypothetical protein
MSPKSKHRAYAGYNDGAKAVNHYNMATCKILTSHNFCHINPPENPTPQEEIEVTPYMLHKGESAGGALPMGATGHDVPTHNLGPKKRKQDKKNDVDINEPQKMHRIHTDYQHLQDPFPEEDDEEDNFLSIEEVYAIIAGDKLPSLKEAKNSPEWPKWEQAMKEELDLLKEMGTWELVQKPPDAI